ncbi:MAG TPA: hypothetical protein VFJ43_10670, partial [Bacteroidia bacterium]|nr:hypothetical protein [Bacteroidia bacterium]
PTKNLALQFSQGFIKSPEALEPNVNITRTTASLVHLAMLDSKQFIASSVVWGQNHTSEGKNLNSVLLESNIKLSPLTIYTRYEFIQKDAHELFLLQFAGNPTFNINALTLGLNKILLTQFQTDLSLGIQGTINFPDNELKSIYGKNPLAGEIYLRFSPTIHHSH